MLCHVFKPERCHHCSVCNRCVLNMDHHCPWINNCVGFYNRKIFILLLIYSLVNLYFILIFMTSPVFDSIYYFSQTTSAIQVFPHMQYIGVYLLVTFLTGILTSFTRFHLQLITKNSTTIENFDKNFDSTIYNMGTKKNWTQVFGRNPWLWGLPIYGQTGRPIGDGVIWPQTFNNDEQREGFEIEESKNNTKEINLNRSKNPSFKQSDSDTSLIGSNKKVLEINLRKD